MYESRIKRLRSGSVLLPYFGDLGKSSFLECCPCLFLSFAKNFVTSVASFVKGELTSSIDK